jgi:DNA-binding MarR family transcriptional regulator
MTVNWLTAAEQTAWRNFVNTMPDLDAAFEADVAAHGITMADYTVLVFLSEAENHRLRMCDLATSLRLSPSGLTRRLDGMVKAGWVDRSACESDRRVMYAHLTPAGLEKVSAAAPDHVDSVRRHFFDPLGPNGVQQLSDLFSVIREHLHESQSA